MQMHLNYKIICISTCKNTKLFVNIDCDTIFLFYDYIYRTNDKIYMFERGTGYIY